MEPANDLLEEHRLELARAARQRAESPVRLGDPDAWQLAVNLNDEQRLIVEATLGSIAEAVPIDNAVMHKGMSVRSRPATLYRVMAYANSGDETAGRILTVDGKTSRAEMCGRFDQLGTSGLDDMSVADSTLLVLMRERLQLIDAFAAGVRADLWCEATRPASDLLVRLGKAPPPEPAAALIGGPVARLIERLDSHIVTIERSGAERAERESAALWLQQTLHAAHWIRGWSWNGQRAEADRVAIREELAEGPEVIVVRAKAVRAECVAAVDAIDPETATALADLATVGVIAAHNRALVDAATLALRTMILKMATQAGCVVVDNVVSTEQGRMAVQLKDGRVEIRRQIGRSARFLRLRREVDPLVLVRVGEQLAEGFARAIGVPPMEVEVSTAAPQLGSGAQPATVREASPRVVPPPPPPPHPSLGLSETGRRRPGNAGIDPLT